MGAPLLVGTLTFLGKVWLGLHDSNARCRAPKFKMSWCDQRSAKTVSEQMVAVLNESQLKNDGMGMGWD